MHTAKTILVTRRPLCRSRKGIALVWVALGGLVLITFMGLMLDTAYVFWTADQYQSAADAAALAAAIQLPIDTSTNYATSRTAAVNTAAANKAAQTSVTITSNTSNDASGDIVLGDWNSVNGTFAANATPSMNTAAVKVTTHGTNNLLFGPIVGISTFNASRTAIAHVGGNPLGAGLVVLGTTGTDINLNNATIKIVSLDTDNKARIWVNSNGTGSNVAVKESSNSTIIADDLYVYGTSSSLQLSGAFTAPAGGPGTSHPSSPQMPDPLGGVPAPSVPTSPVFTSTYTTQNTTLSPGYYQKGIKISGGNTKLSSGIYYIGNGSDTTGFNFNNTTIDASAGVLIYINSGAFTLPSGSINLAPMSTGIYANISIFQSRSNSANTQINGGSTVTLDGALYFPDNNITLTGSGGVQSTGNQIIAKSISMSSGTFNLTYSGNSAFTSSALSAPNQTPYLIK